jgi:hypothetical protein
VKNDGGTTVTFTGRHFGATGAAAVSVLIGTQACLNARWISESLITCVTPPVPTDGTPVVDLPITVIIDGITSNPTPLGVLTGTAGFRYGVADCDPSCGFSFACDDTTFTCERCIPGFTSANCDVPLVTFTRVSDTGGSGSGSSSSPSTSLPPLPSSSPSFLITGETPGSIREDSAAEIRVVGGASVSVTIAFTVSDSTDAQVLPEQRVSLVGGGSARVSLQALADGFDDGNRTGIVRAQVVSGPDQYTRSATRLQLFYITVDAAPEVVDVRPTVVPLAGGIDVTVYGSHWRDWVRVELEGRVIGEFRATHHRNVRCSAENLFFFCF